MIRLTVSSVGVAVLAAMGFVAPTNAGSFGDMAKHIPSDANVVVLFNVQQILNSPMAKSGGWKESHDQAFAAGMVFLPPEATRFVMASRMDMETFTPIWEVVLMDMGGTSFSLAGLAREYGGKIDKVGNADAVYLPTDKYAVKLSDSMFGVRGPGERQAVARWIADVGNVQRLSPYIQQAIGYSERAATDVIMAMDIGDMLSVSEIETRLAGAESLSNKTNVDMKAIGGTLASIRGLTLGIRLGERPYGVLKVEFKESAKPLAGHGKTLLLEALGRRGAMIDDFADWDPKTEENLISIEGYFSEDGMRKIFSIFQVSSTARSVTQGESDTGQQGQSGEENTKKVIAATTQYYNSVQKLFKELKDKEPQRMSQYGAWFEKYAAKDRQSPAGGRRQGHAGLRTIRRPKHAICIDGRQEPRHQRCGGRGAGRRDGGLRIRLRLRRRVRQPVDRQRRLGLRYRYRRSQLHGIPGRTAVAPHAVRVAADTPDVVQPAADHCQRQRSDRADAGAPWRTSTRSTCDVVITAEPGDGRTSVRVRPLLLGATSGHFRPCLSWATMEPLCWGVRMKRVTSFPAPT